MITAGTKTLDRAPGTVLRILATNDLLATFTSMPTTYGHTGSVPLIAELLELELRVGPTIWLDSGDLTGGAARTFLGDHWPTAYSGVPIDAAVAGNHEFDDAELLPRLRHRLHFPLLCADREVGLPAGTIVESAGGSVGVVGVSHPATERLSDAPARRTDWVQAVREEVECLRSQGARWVVALWHDGVAWNAKEARPDAWIDETAPVAGLFDLILGGHTLTGWVGDAHGVPRGQAHGMAGSVLVADLGADGAARLHPPQVLDARPHEGPSSHRSTSQAALDAVLGMWRDSPVGHVEEALVSRPGERNDLGDFVARSWLAHVTDADAAFVPACELWTQPPVDGTVAALRAGVVSELDLRRLFPFDDELVLVDPPVGQWEAMVRSHGRTADFANAAADSVWWNWARGRPGLAQRVPAPRRVVMSRFASLVLGGDHLEVTPVGVRASAPVRAVVQR